MNSNDDIIKLSKKEYYRNYQNQNREKIREIKEVIIKTKLVMMFID